jgi:hypothetical protein
MPETRHTTAAIHTNGRNKNGSEQEFDKVRDWREFREAGFPSDCGGSVGPLCGGSFCGFPAGPRNRSRSESRSAFSEGPNSL